MLRTRRNLYMVLKHMSREDLRALKAFARGARLVCLRTSAAVTVVAVLRG